MDPMKVNSPCNESWDAMRRDAVSRFCAACQKSVYDLATLTPRQIRGLAIVTGGKFCAQQTIVEGALVTAPERPEPATRATRGMSWPIRVAAVAGALSAAACGGAHAEGPRAGEEIGSPTTIEVVAGEPTPTPSPAPQPAPVPREEPEHLKGEMVYEPTLPTRLTFAKGKAKLDAANTAMLDEAVSFLVLQKSGSVAIVGHATPDEGSERETIALGEARAAAAKAYLVGRGIPATRFVTATRGATQPTTRGETEAQRTMNRRVEMRLCPPGEACP